MGRLKTMDQEKKLFELLFEICEGNIEVDGIGVHYLELAWDEHQIRVYHPSGYCFTVGREIERDEEDDPYEYTFTSEYHGFKSCNFKEATALVERSVVAWP